MTSLDLVRGLRCPRCEVDLKEKWDYDEHMKMHVEEDFRNKALVDDARRKLLESGGFDEEVVCPLCNSYTSSRKIVLFHVSQCQVYHRVHQFNNTLKIGKKLLSLIGFANAPEEFNDAKCQVEEEAKKDTSEEAKEKHEAEEAKNEHGAQESQKLKESRARQDRKKKKSKESMDYYTRKLEKMDISEAAGKSGGEGSSKKKNPKKKSGGKGGSVEKGISDLEKAKNQWTTTPQDDNYNVDDGMQKLEKMDVSEAAGKSCGEGSSKKKKPKKKSGGSVGKGISDLEMLYGEGGLGKSSDMEQNTDAAEKSGEGCSKMDLDKKSEKEPAETATAETAEKTEAAGEKETDLSDILLRGLKEAHARYLAALSSSNDASVSVSELEECEKLASQLSLLFGGPAREESSAVNLKIVKAGIDYAFTDAPLRLSFLTCAVIKFASKLPRACFHDILKNLEDRTRNVKTDEDPRSWRPYFTFVDTLQSLKNGEAQGSFEKSSKEEGTDSEPLVWELLDLGGEGGFEARICELYVRTTEGKEGSGKKNEKKIESIRFSAQKTGKGEHEAFIFFSSKFRDKNVTWVNQTKESGLPYDIILEANDKSREYIEVKTTSVANKQWFYISPNEYSFASEKGSSFIVACVELSDGELVRITTYRDPIKLLRSKKMKLVLLPC
ncbi:sister-chromatid cohesion protein 3-like protein [Tanacetum coccineum]